MEEVLWARLIFALGGMVTLATVVMILSGHLRCRDRGAANVR